MPLPLDPSNDKILNLSNEAQVPKIIAELLLLRGIDNGRDAISFLNPDIKDLKPPVGNEQFEKACSLVSDVLKNKGKILIYGDYDVDGAISTVMLAHFLAGLGADVDYYLPNRFSEGYGLNLNAVSEIKDRGAKLIITVDCGISAVKEIKEAVQSGIKVIITDHHRLPPELPPADLILHPAIKECGFSFEKFAGAGVTYYFLIVLRRYLVDNKMIEIDKSNLKHNLKKYLDLVALATIADIVPLINENRILVKTGLAALKEPYFKGLYYLKELSGVSGEPTSFDVGFKLAPRLNAGGRMSSAEKVIELFLTDEEEAKLSIARDLHEENGARRAVQEKIMREALSIVEKDPKTFAKGIVLFSKDWHEGVIGICAGKLSDAYNVPAILFGQSSVDDILKGSARSIEGIDVFEILTRINEKTGLLENFGGHSAAAGLSLQESKFEAFKFAFDMYMKDNFKDEAFVKRVDAEMELSFSEINDELLTYLAAFEPFGEGNLKPLFITNDIEIKNPRILKGKHLKCSVFDKKTGLSLSAIGFNLAEKFEKMKKDLVTIIYSLEYNEFNNSKCIQANIRHII